MMNKKILVISPTPTHPATAGNRARVDALIRAMRKMGHEVYFAHIESEPGDPVSMAQAWGDYYFPIAYTRPPRSLTARLKRRVMRLFDEEAKYIFSIDEWYDSSADQMLSELHRKYRFDTVIVEYVFFSKALECFGPNVLKIIDTHDAFANRHRHYLQKGMKPKWFSTSVKEEGKGFDRADIVVAIQDLEREIFSRQTRARVITVGHMVNLSEYKEEAVKKGSILFVASDNAINVDGINRFIEKIFPLIEKKAPDAELIIAGSVCKAVSDRPGVVKLGRVDDLQPVYLSASVVINPVFLNTGLSIKNLEALGYSRPLVTAPVGAEGIESGVEEAFLVADEDAQFAQAVVRILSDQDYARRLAQAAGAFAAGWNQSVTRQLEEVLD